MTARASYGRGSTSLADFKQLSLLGEGAYSAVYKVCRLADRKLYALKKVKLPSLSEKEKQNALNEVRFLASIEDQHIIDYKEAFFDDKTRCLCIVTEYADAGDLFQQITKCQKERTQIREVDVWRYFFGMCLGLKGLHDMQILHRDLKCANVFLSADDEGAVAKLGDFNVSKVAKRGLCMTQTGTPYYASPEVWRDLPYDAKSDIWSLGCVLYEMVALRPPFRAEDMEGLYRKVLRGRYPRIPALYSQDLSEVIGVLLQVNPRHRPSIDQLLQMPVLRRHTPRENSQEGEATKANDLLETIKLPKNAVDLSICLPKPRYDTSAPVLHEPPPQNCAAAADLGSASGGDGEGSGKVLPRGGRGACGVSMPPPPHPPEIQPLPPRATPTQRGGGAAAHSLSRPPMLEQNEDGIGSHVSQDMPDSFHRHLKEPVPDSLDAYLQQKNQQRPDGTHEASDRLAPEVAQALGPLGRDVSQPRVGGGRQHLGLRASPTPPSPAQQSVLPVQWYRQQREREQRRTPMASYARAQYAFSAQAAAPPPPAKPASVATPGLRLPRIHSNANC